MQHVSHGVSAVIKNTESTFRMSSHTEGEEKSVISVLSTKFDESWCNAADDTWETARLLSSLTGKPVLLHIPVLLSTYTSCTNPELSVARSRLFSGGCWKPFWEMWEISSCSRCGMFSKQQNTFTISAKIQKYPEVICESKVFLVFTSKSIYSSWSFDWW